jgi:cytochrome oxidase assembly protein ShyY1
VIVMINLGFWQLDRLQQKKDRNEAIIDRSSEQVVDIGELAVPTDPVDVGGELEFRAVSATGTYELEDQALLRSRDLDGSPGFWVLTPLDVGDGTSVVVIRGWVPFVTETDGSDLEYPTPTGEVTVTGIASRHFGGAVPAGDEQATIAHLDLEWFDEHVDADVYPVAIQLLEQDPPSDATLPVVLEPPELSEGPHLSYAVQWFLFSAVVVIGYPFLLRRIAHQRARGVGSGEGSGREAPHADEHAAEPAVVSGGTR